VTRRIGWCAQRGHDGACRHRGRRGSSADSSSRPTSSAKPLA
jgi:hypothetical protein